MSSITDDAGVEITYWPITGLLAGEENQVIVIRVPAPQPRQLFATPDARIITQGRITGSGGPFVNLSVWPIDLAYLAGPYVRVDVKLLADAGVGPFERIPITVGARRSAPASWSA